MDFNNSTRNPNAQQIKWNLISFNILKLQIIRNVVGRMQANVYITTAYDNRWQTDEMFYSPINENIPFTYAFSIKARE